MSDHGEYQYQQLKEDPNSFVNQKDEVMDKEFEEEFMCYNAEERELIIKGYNFAKQHWLDKAVEVAESHGGTVAGLSNAGYVLGNKIKELKK